MLMSLPFSSSGFTPKRTDLHLPHKMVLLQDFIYEAPGDIYTKLYSLNICSSLEIVLLAYRDPFYLLYSPSVHSVEKRSEEMSNANLCSVCCRCEKNHHNFISSFSFITCSSLSSSVLQKEWTLCIHHQELSHHSKHCVHIY